MKEIDIEKLAHDELQGAEMQPPDSAWETLQGRLANGAATTTGKSAHGKRWTRHVALWTAVSAVVLGATIGIIHTYAQRQAPEMIAQRVDNMTDSESDNINAVLSSENLPVDDAKQQTLMTTDNTVNKNAAGTPSVGEPTTASSVTESPVVESIPTATTNSTLQSEATANTVLAQATSTTTATSSTPTATNRNIAPEKDAGPQNAQSVSDTATKAFNIVIPNLITPNGDGYNDCWGIPGIEQYAQVNVQIFNAQSKRVYANSHYDNNFCGDDMPDGNYFYIVVIAEENFTRRGVLVIKR